MASESRRILIVEDQFLIAKQLEMILVGAGHVVVGIAATALDANTHASRSKPEIALVDVNLADGITGPDVAGFLARDYGVFITANPRRLPPDYAGAAGVIEKPFTKAGIIAAVNYIAARISNATEAAVAPNSLRLSPNYGGSGARHCSNPQ